MNFMDKMKGLAGKAEDLAAEHKDEIKGALDKAEGLVDQKTRGKYHDQIQKASGKAEEFVGGLGERDGATPEGTATPPAEPGPPPAA